MANELGGRWTANAHHRADVQYFAQIGRRVKTQRGIPMFSPDKDRKYPLIIVQVAEPEPEPEPVAVVVEAPKPVKVVRPTPTEQAHERVAFDDWMNADVANRKKIQDAARHQFINKMYADLLGDMEICKLEGWDVLEYPRMLRDAINRIFPKPKQLTIQFA